MLFKCFIFNVTKRFVNGEFQVSVGKSRNWRIFLSVSHRSPSIIFLSAYIHTCQPPEYTNLQTSRNLFSLFRGPSRTVPSSLHLGLQWGGRYVYKSFLYGITKTLNLGKTLKSSLLNEHHMVLLSTITLGLNAFPNSIWSQSLLKYLCCRRVHVFIGKELI